MSKQKLELTWLGKGNQPKLEPRILIEDPDRSYGDRNTENMLIFGDIGALAQFDETISINIFNISKINAETKGGKQPRIKRLSEYISLE